MLKTINSGDPEFNQRDTTPGFSAQVYTTYTVCLQGCISRTVIHLPEKVFPWFCWMLGKILHSQSCSVDITSSLRWEQLCILPLPPQTGMWATGVSQSPTIHPHLCTSKFYKPGDAWRSSTNPTVWTSAFSVSWEEIWPAVSVFSFLICPVVFMILGKACWDSALPSFTCRLLASPF